MAVGEDTDVKSDHGNEVSLLLSDEEQKYLDSRVHDLEKAAIRSRWIFGSMLAISLMLFSVAYNEYFSWYRKMAESLPLDYSETGWGSQLRGFLMQEWVDSLQFDLPYVGGRFGASDAGIVGGVLLLMISFWCFLAAKRENHIVYFLIKDVIEFDFSDAARFYLRGQIFSTQLFSFERSKSYGPDDLNIKSLLKSNGEVENKRFSSASWKSRRIYVAVETWLTAISSFVFVFMAPVISLIFVFAVDLSTLSEASPFRKHDPKGAISKIFNAKTQISRDVYVKAFISKNFDLTATGSKAFNEKIPISKKVDARVEPKNIDAGADERPELSLVNSICGGDAEPKLVGNLFGSTLVRDLVRCEDKALLKRIGLSFALIIFVAIAMIRAYVFQRATQNLIRATSIWKGPIIKARKAALKRTKASLLPSSSGESPSSEVQAH